MCGKASPYRYRESSFGFFMIRGAPRIMKLKKRKKDVPERQSLSAHQAAQPLRRHMLRRINLSAALIVLICFFLPWEQVSCGGAKDTLSGFDLARHDQFTLWLLPPFVFAGAGSGFGGRAHGEP